MPRAPRPVIARTAAATLAVAAIAPALDAATFVPWTQYQADAAHTGHVAATVAVPTAQPLWSMTATQLSMSSLFAGAATDANHVYLTTSDAAGYHILALNRTTGSTDWSTPALQGGYGSPTAPSAANGIVYTHIFGHSGISGGNSSQYPRVQGFDASTGTRLFDSTHSGQWSSGSRPTVDANQVFAAGGYYGGLDAYDASSGAHQWFSNVNQQYGWTPAADADRVYVYMGPASASPGPGIGTLYAFNRSGGGTAFTILNPADSFTLYNGTVTLGSQHDALTLTRGSSTEITSFDLTNRTVRWSTPGTFSGSFAVDDGFIFANAGNKVTLLDEATGSLLNSWTAPDGGTLTGNIAVTDNLIFAQTTNAFSAVLSSPTTYAIDRSTLTTAWSTSTVGDIAIDSDLLIISNATSVTAFALPEPSLPLTCAAATLITTTRRRRAR